MPASIFNGDAIKILKDKLRFKDGTEITSTEAGYLAGTSSDIQTQLDAKVDDSEKGAASGVATLDANSRLTDSERNLNNDTFLAARNAGDTADVDLIKLNSSNQIELSNGTLVLLDGDMRPTTTNTYNLGNASLQYNNIYSNILRATGVVIERATIPSGSTLVPSFGTASSQDAAIFTGNNTAADAVLTRQVFIETGNKTSASATGGTGNIRIKTGDAAGTVGDSGGICLETGTSANGTRGSLLFDEVSRPSASVGYAWTLQNVSTGEGAWDAIPSAGNRVVATYSSTTTAGGSDEVILLSGATFTLSLPTAVGITGKIYEIVHTGTNLTQVYTIDANSSETIRGNLTFLMHTNGERLRIVSDGSNWVVLDHFAETDWIDSGAIGIGAITSAPTKPTGIAVDRMFWKRKGNNVHIRMEYKQTNTTSGANGTNDYLFGLPTNITFDSSEITFYSTAEGLGIYTTTNGLGTTNTQTGSESLNGIAVAYDANNFRMFVGGPNSTGAVGSGYAQILSNINLHYIADFIAPATDWEY